MSVDTKPLTVAEAIARRDEAARHLDDLTARVTSGDTDVSLDELNDARDQAEYAALMVEGARNRARREAEEQFRSEVEAFRAEFPKRLVEPFAEVAGFRSKAVAALLDLIDAVGEVERVRADVKLEWSALRPDDVPLDFEEDLPAWYVEANPSRYTAVPVLDEFKAVMAVAVEALRERQRGEWGTERAQCLRNIEADIKVKAHESSFGSAVQRLTAADEQV